MHTDILERIVEAVRLAPTSSGLQPFELLVVSNADARAKIRAVAWDQAQVTDCSHLLVFAAWDDITADRVDMMFNLTNEVRGFKNEGWEKYRRKLLVIVVDRGTEANYQAAARQAYIGLGIALVAAAFEQVDATPMEGFDPAAVDQIPSISNRSICAACSILHGDNVDAACLPAATVAESSNGSCFFPTSHW